MSIVIITGGKGSGKSLVANALRNSAIRDGRGALLVDDNQDGEHIHLLEKLSLQKIEPGTEADKIEWKKDPTIILVGKKAGATLDAFEKIAPGVKKKFGPVYTIDTAKG